MLAREGVEGLTPATFLKVVHGKALFQLDLPFNDKGIPIIKIDMADVALLGYMTEVKDSDLTC